MTSGPFEALARAATPRMLAALARRGAELGDAQDALQEALTAAAVQWPRDGIPADPTGWLITVAGRRLVDHWRSERARRERETVEFRSDAEPVAVCETDDSVTLLLLCCHPALPPTSQVALTLRAVAGLSTAQIAHGFLVPETTMAQRLSRARARLREVGARFGSTTAPELPARVAATREVLYLIFTEGHTSTGGEGLLDLRLSDEAVRLTRLLHAHIPSDGETAGLLALMLLTDARRSARLTPDGTLVPLPEQDRGRWDAAKIGEGVSLIERALPTGPVGVFQLQAAIAAVHAEATAAESTDWAQIEALYRMLERVDPGPMVTLNRAVAVAMVDGPAAGLALLETVAEDRRLTRHHRVPAVRAHLWERAGRLPEAAAEYRAAARLATSGPEQRYLNEQADRLAGMMTP